MGARTLSAAVEVAGDQTVGYLHRVLDGGGYIRGNST
jgi:hypothetical protein